MKKQITVTIPEQTVAEIKKLAAQEQRNFSNMLTVLAMKGIEERKNKAA